MNEVYWMGNDKDGYRVSLRWSAAASHPAASMYGDQTASNLQVWGLTQFEVINEQVTREWTVFNELDLMMQIEALRQGLRI